MTSRNGGEIQVSADLAEPGSPWPILVRGPNAGMMTLDGTNTWVILGPDGVAVIDPGPSDATHVAAIECHGPIDAVVLTHGHLDHSAAIDCLPPDIPVHAASPAFARGSSPARDGDVIVAGGIQLRVHALPGHTSDSIGLTYDGGNLPSVLFTGDTLLGGPHSTLLVSSDGGNMGEYLHTLERLAGMPGLRGMPGHGPVIGDVAAHAKGALAHRRMRLDQLHSAITSNPSIDLSTIASERYPRDPHRQAVARRMLEVEFAYLRSIGLTA